MNIAHHAIWFLFESRIGGTKCVSMTWRGGICQALLIRECAVVEVSRSSGVDVNGSIAFPAIVNEAGRLRVHVRHVVAAQVEIENKR